MKGLRQHLDGTHDYVLHCPRAPYCRQLLLSGLSHANTIIGLSLLASIGAIVSYLFLVGACSDFYSLDLVLIADDQLPVVLGRFAGGQHVARANRVGTHCGGVAVADEMHMFFECPALHTLRQQYAPLFSTNTDTMRSFFAQQDHMQVFKFVLSCLDVLQI